MSFILALTRLSETEDDELKTLQTKQRDLRASDPKQLAKDLNLKANRLQLIVDHAMSLVVNGGAVVALLTYLEHSPQGASLASHAFWSLGAFIAGVVLCVAAFFGSYQTQFTLYNETVSPASVAGLSHMVWQRITFGLVLLSCIAFAVGAFCSVSMLSQ